MQPAGQCGSHWLGRLMAGGSLTRPEGSPWPLALPQGTLGPASSSSMDPAKGVPSQSGPPEGLGLRPKRSWRALEETMCPLCKRTRSGALERT
ncbi:rCG49877, isoform CRA_a [Rattus norvegicus]|uniref:RCG49877, isoform CRA_a n=1 Tax=Rattus norvegicus TaxID=10116 RepID=A6K4U6_RAT|nr:rCG49877, isoform CRA_a [Rattus norvegicus]